MITNEENSKTNIKDNVMTKFYDTID